MSNYVILAIAVLAYMTLWFCIGLVKKRNDVADLAWGIGFVVVAWFALAISPNPGWRGVLVNLLVTIWGVRLARHITQRIRSRPEDARYRAWRETWKWFNLRSFLQIFVLQGALLYLISVPGFIVHANGSGAFDVLAVLGVLVWIVGFIFESVADAQLAKFIGNPASKGKILDTGLWRYSRHPNYFGEVTMWWGIWIIAASLPSAWLGLVGPFTITTLILFVSGVPMLEKLMADKPGFAEYRKRTSVFFPLPPKK